MPLRVFRRRGSKIYSFEGTVAGRRLRGSTRTADKARAERIASQIETDEWKSSLDGPEAVLTFAKAAMLYRAAGKETRFLPKVEDHWKDMLVKDIKPGAIRQAAIDALPGRSAATWIREFITPTQAVINHCADLELCPMIRVKRPKVEKKIKKPILLDWLNSFCPHARPDIRALAIFMLATGCRISEARRLEWEDIDFKDRTILIRKSKNKKARMPHMPQVLLVALANLSRDRKPFFACDTTLRTHWDLAIQRASEADPDGKFERLTFHSCRHGFATTLLRKGIDPKTAASLGGWDSIQLFMDTYAHEIQDRSLTEGIFDTTLTPAKAAVKQNQ